MNLETKIIIYKFTPQVFTLTHLIVVVQSHIGISALYAYYFGNFLFKQSIGVYNNLTQVSDLDLGCHSVGFKSSQPLVVFNDLHIQIFRFSQPQ